MINEQTEWSATQNEELLDLLKSRFETNMSRHKGLEWAPIMAKLKAQSDRIYALYQMEQTGGEPDVISYDQETDQYTFYDCSQESPIGRRSICYDRQALESRKENRPENSAVEMAADMGIEMLNEAQYRELQKHGAFDLKTSNWVRTPEKIREQGGALFCDRRYDMVFVYHNGAQSYYSARGFRGLVKV